MSNRLTFSLASLVLFLALGLVFAPVSVMAHPVTATNNVSGQIHDGDTVGMSHSHPMVTVMIDDGDPLLDGMQILDTKADSATDTQGLTLQFDLKYSVPYNHGALLQAPTPATLTGYVTASGVYVQVYDPTTNMSPVGMTALAQSHIDSTTDPDITAAAAKMWKQTLTLSFDTAANRDMAIKNDMKVALMVGAGAYTVPDTILGTLDTGQSNLVGSRQVYTVVDEASDARDAPSDATVTVAADTYHGGGRFQVTFTFGAMDAPTDFGVNDIMVTGGGRVLPGSVDPVTKPPTGKKQWTAIIESFLETNTADIVVTVKRDANNVIPAVTSGSVTVKAKAATTVTKATTGAMPLSGILKAKQFGIIARTASVDGIGTVTAMVDMPDLQRFLAVRGSITLYTTDTATIKANDVVISEIMWGLNLVAAVENRQDHQWIELYNATDSDILLSKIQIDFHDSFALPTDTNKIDQFSNVEHAGWTVDQGQNGSLIPSENENAASSVALISMYRNINYNKVEAELAKVKGDVKLNYGERNKGIPNGRAKGSWLTSNIADIYLANRIGSPGGKHIVVGGDYGATSVPRSPIIITEVGNLNGMDHDWIELTALANVNLEKYELQYVKSDKTIVVLAQFVKKELKAGEILLVLGTHPATAGHPVAAGKEWKLAVADQVRPKASSLYHVDSRMQLPDDIGKATFILRKEKDKKNHEHIVDLAGNLLSRIPVLPIEPTCSHCGRLLRDTAM